MAEIAVPATALRNPALAKWARGHGIAVNAKSGEDLQVALATGIHPGRLTVHGDEIGPAEFRSIAKLGVGRVVVCSAEQIADLAATNPVRPHNVLIRVTDTRAAAGALGGSCGFRFDSRAVDEATAAVLGEAQLNLVGLHCDVGCAEPDFVSYSAAIGHKIAEMTHIRRVHGVLPTRLSLAGGRTVAGDDRGAALSDFAAHVEVSLDDACAAQRFPRPALTLSVVCGRR